MLCSARSLALARRYRNGQLLLEVAESLEQRPVKGAVYAGAARQLYGSLMWLQVARQHYCRLHS
jgi:hypothetical protein